MKYILLFIILLSMDVAFPQNVDSALQYRWPNSNNDTMQWPLTYGWYDTTKLRKEEGVIWIMDTLTKKVTVEENGWRVTLRFPPPPSCSCIGKWIFKEFLDETKHPFSRTAYVKTSLDLYHEQHRP